MASVMAASAERMMGERRYILGDWYESVVDWALRLGYRVQILKLV